MSLLNILVYSFSILANLTLGLVVFFHNPKKIINRFFTLFTLPIAGWLVTLFILANVSSYKLVSLSARLNSAFLILLGFALFYFSYYFPERTFSLTPLLNFVLALETFSLIVLTLLTLEITGIGAVAGESLTIYGRLYPIFVIHFLLYSGSSLLILLFKREKFRGFPRAQIDCLFLGLTGGLLFGVMMHILLPWLFKVHNFQLLRPLLTLVFLGLTAYGMVRFRLLDIRLIVARTVAYFGLIFLIGLLITSGLYAFSVLVVGRSIERSQIFISILLVLFILFAFPTLNKFFEKMTDKIFFKERYDTAALLRKLSLIVASTLPLDDLVKNVLDELKNKMKVTRGSVVLIKDAKVLENRPSPMNHLSLLWQEKVLDFLNYGEDINKILIFDELKEGKIKEMLRALKLSLVVPFKVRGEKVGLLLLGEKASGEIYSVQDIAVLEILGPELAVAVQNALAYEEIRRFNLTLKEEIKKAISELRRANEKLKELDKLKDEFLSIATHELRTPMTAVKGYLDMVLSGDAGRINVKTKEFLSEALEVTNRLADLVNDMLDVSRIEQKELSLEIKELDLSLEIKKVLEQLMSLAKEKKLLLSYKPSRNLPRVRADSAKLRQVLNNLVGNAIKFTQKGKITISQQLSKNSVVVNVKDTGIGISKADFGKLFQKFSRLDGGLSRQQGGTGLGLFISKGLIEHMGGKIWVKSKLGQGATFSFSLQKVS